MDRETLVNYVSDISASQLSNLTNNNSLQNEFRINHPNLMEILLNLHNSEDLMEDLSDNGEINNQLGTDTPSANSCEFINDISYGSNRQSNSSLSNEGQSLDDPNHLLMNNGAIINNGRALTAPARTVNEILEFKWTSHFMNLEKAVMYCNRLIVLQPESKFDVDSEEGSDICKKFLEQLEKLIKVNIYLKCNKVTETPYSIKRI